MNLAKPHLSSHPPNGAGLRLIGTGDSPSDDALLDRIDERDVAAFALFYDRHCNAAYWLACHILGETEAACVAMEEAFMQVWREPVRRGRARETARASLLSCVNQSAFAIRVRDPR